MSTKFLENGSHFCVNQIIISRTFFLINFLGNKIATNGREFLIQKLTFRGDIDNFQRVLCLEISVLSCSDRRYIIALQTALMAHRQMIEQNRSTKKKSLQMLYNSINNY